VKTPLPFLALIGFGGVAWYQKNKGKLLSALYSLAPLLALFVIYWIASIFTNLNIGHRHLLPTYPVLFVLAGANVFWLTSEKRWIKPTLIALLCWFVLGSIWIRPHYLSYFNWLAGGPKNGYKHLVDSSLDWGQDLPALSKWLAKNNKDGERAYFSYFGTGDPEFYGIRCYRLPSFFDWQRPKVMFPLQPGIYCVSATMLQSVYSVARGKWNDFYEKLYHETREELIQLEKAKDQKKFMEEKGEDYWKKRIEEFDHLRFARLCAFLRERKPDAWVGYSILVFRLTQDELDRALLSTPLELLYEKVRE
jgi:hypothetical protein